MKFLFSELVELNELQPLCEIFSNLTGFVTAILDMEGNVLTATGWREICAEFHRKNPAAVNACRESDTVLGELPSPGAKYNVYRCKNGLIDVSVPIMVEKVQIGRLYTGQFLFAPPDVEFFRRQAAEYGFDETSYLDAVQKVPIVTEEQVRQVMEFLCRLAEMIGRMAVGNQRLREANAELMEHRQELERLVEERTTELSAKNERLRASLAEKEVLLKEVHHRVKNNLQIISTLLELQAYNIHDDNLQKCLKDSQDRIKAMALIHEKLYQSSDLVCIDFWEYIESLVGHLISSFVDDPQRIVMKVDVGDIQMGIERAIPYGLIINELVSNAIKHAFPNGRSGEIEIRLRADERGWITLTVADDGVGLPPGLDFRNTETLGLQLVNLLTKQLQGELSLVNDGGATFTIRFAS